jgi:hypothetical protein
MPTVRTIATVTSAAAVDGTTRRRSPAAASRSGRVTATAVHPGVLELARRLAGPGQLLRIDSPTVVSVVNRRPARR